MGGLPTSTVNGFAVHPSNPRAMYAALRDGIFLSDDTGATWTPASNSPRNVAAVAVNPKQPSEVYAVTAEGRIYLTRNGGATWEARR